MSDCNIFIEILQKYMKCTGKHSVKVQISLDAENKIMQMIRRQYTLAVKNKLNKQMQEYGVCMFCEVS